MDERIDYRALANQERAYVAASRRPDRSIRARLVSGESASDIHHQRTGRSLHITREIILSDAQYDEVDDVPSRRRSHDNIQGQRPEGVTKQSGGAFEKSQLKRKADAIESRYNAMDRLFNQSFPNGFPTSSVPDLPAPLPTKTNNGEKDNDEMIMSASPNFSQTDFSAFLQEPTGLEPQVDSPSSVMSSIPPLSEPRDSPSWSAGSGPSSASASPVPLSGACPGTAVEPTSLHSSQTNFGAEKAAFTSPAEAAVRAAELNYDDWLQDVPPPSYGCGYDPDLVDALRQNTDLGQTNKDPKIIPDELATGNDAFFGFEVHDCL